MKLLSLAALTSLAATSVAAGKCPKESTCIQEACSNFQISKRVHTDEHKLVNSILEADCVDRHGTKVFTWLDLKQCIVNRKGEMYWGSNGNYNCQTCEIKERKSDSDPVIMSCWCPDGKWGMTDFDLSEGIWHYDGVIGCYSWDGHKQPIAPVKKRSLPELPAEAAVEARDADDDLSARDPGLTDDPLGAVHHRTPAEPQGIKIPGPLPPISNWRGMRPWKVPVTPRSDDVVDEEVEDVEVGGSQRFRRF